MKSAADIAKKKIQRIKMVCFDSDGVLVEKGTKIINKNGKLLVQTHLPSRQLLEKLQKLAHKYWLVIPSGRNLIYLARLYESLLSANVALIGENGIFGLWKGKVHQFYRFQSDDWKTLEEVRGELRNLMKKDRNLIAFEPKQFLITLHSRQYVSKVCDIVRHHRRGNELNCLWNTEAFDIGFRWLTKAFAVKKLAKTLNIGWEEILAVGNDSNDGELAKQAGISITTDPQANPTAKFYTRRRLHLGGEEVVDKLLTI